MNFIVQAGCVCNIGEFIIHTALNSYMGNKIIFILSLLALTATANAQRGDTVQPNMYIYNNRQDTIRFSNISYGRFASGDTKIVDSVQVNGKGAKELVFYRSCSGSLEDHGGSFDISEYRAVTRYEVWDTDTKTLLFSAVNSYFHTYANFQAYRKPTHSKGTDWYDYRFTINSNGKITITDLPGRNIFNPVRNEPVRRIPADHEAGVYKYSGGSYRKMVTG